MASPRLLATSIPVLTALALASCAHPALCQSYGLGEQILVVGAAAFQPYSAAGDHHSYDLPGYLTGSGPYFAPVSLPDGAEVLGLCLYAYDPNPGSSVDVRLQEIKLPAGGQDPGETSVPGSFVRTNFDIGYGAVCTGPLSYTIHSTDAGMHFAHRLYGFISENGGIGGIRIFWRRQVSAPPPTPTFNDVPNTDGARPFIDALVAAGITAGCNTTPRLYCPDKPVTRRQMAAFLARALGLHWPY